MTGVAKRKRATSASHPRWGGGGNGVERLILCNKKEKKPLIPSKSGGRDRGFERRIFLIMRDKKTGQHTSVPGRGKKRTWPFMEKKKEESYASCFKEREREGLSYGGCTGFEPLREGGGGAERGLRDEEKRTPRSQEKDTFLRRPPIQERSLAPSRQKGPGSDAAGERRT